MDLYEKIARKHVASLGEILPRWKFDIGERQEFILHIYFDYVFSSLNGAMAEPPYAGGAVGFVIDKESHRLKEVSFGDYMALKQNRLEADEAYQMVKELEKGGKAFLWFKKKYKLNSGELHKIKRMLRDEDLSREHILEELDRWISKIR